MLHIVTIEREWCYLHALCTGLWHRWQITQSWYEDSHMYQVILNNFLLRHEILLEARIITDHNHVDVIYFLDLDYILSLCYICWRFYIPVNGREYRRGNQTWIIQRKTNQKHNTICVGHHYTHTNTNNVNKTWFLLQTTGSKNEPNIVFMWKS